jgi:hypothetical protein
LVGAQGYAPIKPFFTDSFQGFLCFFLFNMGLKVMSQREGLRKFTFSLISFGIYMPFIGALLGIAISKCLGLDQASAFLFTVLSASASYIAVPAALMVALPQAQSSIYLPLALGVTFPFNILLGIPLYYAVVCYLFK